MLKRPRPLLTCRARVLRSVLTVIALAVTSSGLTAVVFGVGDIGMCGQPGVAQTARLVAGLEGGLLLAGDIAYPQGTAANFRDCFNPEWGRTSSTPAARRSEKGEVRSEK